ncbi:hypothetical protein [Actinomyces sp. ICM58]|uniref:hypothetical protein n=1 Tax=Actinomyces sp. ICM58 TaxID=1105030 RepID=UPI0012DBDA1F|nr:hypothetical protein [Actinomyces sp. ICM58]
MTDKNQKAMLTRSSIRPVSGDTPCLDVFLAYARTHSGGDVQGLAFATNGTWTVLGFDKGSSAEKPKLSVTPIDGREFDPTNVFELRLWVPVKLPDEPAGGAVLAHEYRWVNGVGAVELTLTAARPEAPSKDTEPASVSGWFHKVSYLQHKSAASSDRDSTSEPTSGQTEQDEQHADAKPMTAVEFIQEEKYGNTVVVEQLFTGKWS